MVSFEQMYYEYLI